MVNQIDIKKRLFIMNSRLIFSISSQLGNFRDPLGTTLEPFLGRFEAFK
jgi:hypothetical protein